MTQFSLQSLQRWGANYWEDFYKQKIAWASVGKTFYSLVPKDYFLLDTNYFFSVKYPIYLLCVFNSKLITYWINSVDTPIGEGGAYRHYKYNLLQLKVKPSTNELSLKIKQHYLKGELSEIDNIVYEMYNISEPEKMFIEAIDFQ